MPYRTQQVGKGDTRTCREKLKATGYGGGRTASGRTPILETEGLITPIDSYYVVAQLQMHEPIHPDDWVLSIGGEVERPIELTLDELRKLPGRTVRAGTECAGNDTEFFNYLRDGGKKPSLASKQDMQALTKLRESGQKPSLNDITEAIPSTCLVSAGEFTGASLVMSPFDEQALEAALRIRDVLGDVKITVVSLGPDSAREVLKPGLSMGADEAVLLSDPAFEGTDSYTTALALAAAIKKIGEYALILAGRQAADWGAGVVGLGIAELLGIPAITFARDVQVHDRTVRVECVLQNGFETVEASLPAMVTISNELGEPRSPNLRQVMRAARKKATACSCRRCSMN